MSARWRGGLDASPSQVVAARNETLIENPGLLARNAECVDDAWLVEVEVDADEVAELVGFVPFPERSPT